jgi:hypothetical protein
MLSFLPLQKLFRILDFFIAIFFIRPKHQKDFRKRLEDERAVFEGGGSSKTTGEQGGSVGPHASQPNYAKYVDHYTNLLQVNHQRVSASISHVSIMGAILMYSTKSVFVEHSWSLLAVQTELCVYLFVIIALLRCLRDYGLDEDYVPTFYADGMLEELSFRYGILRACNLILITGTLIFSLLFILHFVIDAMHYHDHTDRD